jgi:hypothetical protein
MVGLRRGLWRLSLGSDDVPKMGSPPRPRSRQRSSKPGRIQPCHRRSPSWPPGTVAPCARPLRTRPSRARRRWSTSQPRAAIRTSMATPAQNSQRRRGRRRQPSRRKQGRTPANFSRDYAHGAFRRRRCSRRCQSTRWCCRSQAGRRPLLGQIIVFHPPAGADPINPVCGNSSQGAGHSAACDEPTPKESRQTFIKRVVGLPGDHIRILNGDIYRNGVKEDAPYTEPCSSEDTTCTFTTTITVPPGDCYVLGDNRGRIGRQPVLGSSPAGLHHRHRRLLPTSQ